MESPKSIEIHAEPSKSIETSLEEVKQDEELLRKVIKKLIEVPFSYWSDVGWEIADYFIAEKMRWQRAFVGYVPWKSGFSGYARYINPDTGKKWYGDRVLKEIVSKK